MKLYRTTATFERDPENVTTKTWQSSQADASAARAKAKADGARGKDVETETFEFATNKEGLLAFLNGLG